MWFGGKLSSCKKTQFLEISTCEGKGEDSLFMKLRKSKSEEGASGNVRVPKGYLSQKQKKDLRKEIMATQVDRKGPEKTKNKHIKKKKDKRRKPNNEIINHTCNKFVAINL